MKIMRTVFASALFLLLAMAAPAFAQQEQQEEKPENPKTEAKPAPPDRAKPADRKDEARPAQEPQRQPEDRRTQEQENRRQDATRGQQEQEKQQHDRGGEVRNDERREQQQTAHRDNDRSGGGRPHGRIPDDRFHANFGREHHFRIGQRPVIVEGAPRFQYGGYWFELAQPWPTDWVYTDDFYIDYLDGDYYMYDPRFPAVRILVYVIEL